MRRGKLIAHFAATARAGLAELAGARSNLSGCDSCMRAFRVLAVLAVGPTPLNPLGVKGAGEDGCTGVGAAIGSAVADALGRSAPVDTIPLTPRRLRDLFALPSDPP